MLLSTFRKSPLKSFSAERTFFKTTLGKQSNWNSSWQVHISKLIFTNFICKKQPTGGVLRKRCSENMQQIYRRKPIPECDLNKVATQLYWSHTSARVFSSTLLEGCFWSVSWQIFSFCFLRVAFLYWNQDVFPILELCSCFFSSIDASELDESDGNLLSFLIGSKLIRGYTEEIWTFIF